MKVMDLIFGSHSSHGIDFLGWGVKLGISYLVAIAHVV